LTLAPVLLYAEAREKSRIGDVLHPELGLRFEAAAATTVLPQVSDNPIDYGLQRFCEQSLFEACLSIF
jgi:hypothetical protein